MTCLQNTAMLSLVICLRRRIVSILVIILLHVREKQLMVRLRHLSQDWKQWEPLSRVHLFLLLMMTQLLSRFLLRAEMQVVQ